MNMICYERGLVWTSLLWTWSIRVVYYEHVCFERTLL